MSDAGGYSYICPMENELKDALFLPGDLLDAPEIRAIVFLPLEEHPSSAEMQMLERMLEAMSYYPGEWRYLFHKGSPDWALVDEKDPCILFFASSNDAHKIPEKRSEGKFLWFFLPSLGLMYADQKLKRSVWDLIKP